MASTNSTATRGSQQYKNIPGKPPIKPPINQASPLLPSPKQTEPQIPKVRFFALLIGINDYLSPDLRTLRGAEKDAQLFEEYLIQNLQVPKDHIELILGKDATRSRMIKGFRDLKADRRIEKDDALLIYYAGHGGEVNPPGKRDAGVPGGKIQMIIPHDYLPGSVPCIPDYTIGALIDEIARVKGNNITTIFDCCHAASGTRDTDGDILVRSAELPTNAHSPELDPPLQVHEETRGTATYRPAGQSTHILLAACAPTELAHESQGHGKFSDALLKLLRLKSPEQLTYNSLFKHMEIIPGQNPHCEGSDFDRFLFGGRLKPRSPEKYWIDPEEPPSTFATLQAGSIQGVTSGAEFTIFPDDPVRKMTLTVAESKVKAFTSVLTGPADSVFTEKTWALQTKIGNKEDFRLYIPPDDRFLNLFKEAIEDPAFRETFVLDNIVLTEDVTAAHLSGSVHVEPSKEGPGTKEVIVFEMKDTNVTGHGFSRIFPSMPADVETAARILGGAAHFYRSLNRAPGPKETPSLAGKIGVELYQLEETDPEDEDTEETTYCPSDDAENLCQKNVIDFVPQEDVYYGLKLVNNSLRDLYPYAYYFDNTKLSIASFYTVPHAQNGMAYPPLKKKGNLTLGYGIGGVQPFVFTLNPGQDIDVGFLKIIVSTKPVDLRHIPQGSPFDITRSMDQVDITQKRDAWDTLLIPVIQRREPKKNN